MAKHPRANKEAINLYYYNEVNLKLTKKKLMIM